MSKFKKGDRVIGNNNMNWEPYIGEIFTVERVDGDKIFVEGGGFFYSNKLDPIVDSPEKSTQTLIVIKNENLDLEFTIEEAREVYEALKELF